MNAGRMVERETYESARREAARSRSYGLFARAFRYPDATTVASLADGRFDSELRSVLVEAYPEIVDKFEQDFESKMRFDVPVEDFQASYLAAFDNDLPKPSVSLYEGSYRTKRGNRPELLIELKSLYRYFGLAMAENDVEDILIAELEFMQFLAAKQAHAMSEGGDPVPYLRAQRDFLSRHLADWLPALEFELEAKLGQGFYCTVGRLMANFVALDTIALERRYDAGAASRPERRS